MTFSIVARDPERDLFGVAVSTAVPCVGGVCTYAKAGVGAIASQSYVNVRLGRESAALLVVPPEVSDLTPTVDIRVDQHPDPVAELRRIFNLLRERYRQAMEELQREQGEG